MVIILNLSFEGGDRLFLKVTSTFLHVLAGMFWAFSRSTGDKRPQNTIPVSAPRRQ